MGKAVPAQHPAVVLRSHYRALLAIAIIAVVGLTAAVVILAINDDDAAVSPIAGSATQVAAPGPTGSTRYDGGPEEGSRGVVPAQAPNTRYDGGPEEGTRGITSGNAPSTAAAGVRFDGGPEEGSRGLGR